jgi:hypothetical protein
MDNRKPVLAEISANEMKLSHNEYRNNQHNIPAECPVYSIPAGYTEKRNNDM